MVNALAKVKYGYTDKGNKYQKSSDGKKAGAIAGATAVGVSCVPISCDGLGYKLKFETSLFNHFNRKYSEQINKVVDICHKIEQSKNPIAQKLTKAGGLIWEGLNKLPWRVHSIVVGTAAIAAMSGTAALIGRGIGACYDKVVDKFSQHKADKQAEKAAKAE